MSINEDTPFYGLTRTDMLSILDHTGNGLYLTDASLHIIFVNRQLCKELQQSFPQLRFQPVENVSHPAFNKKVLAHCLRTKQRITWRSHLKDGSIITATSTPILDDAGEVLLLSTLIHACTQEPEESVENFPPNVHHLQLRSQYDNDCQFITTSPAVEELLTLAEKVAGSSISVLISGSTGTGKSLLARHIHQHSATPSAPFVEVNCAAIPESLLESELFGYAPNAFTGASAHGKVGLFDQANGGTLFLDEIGDLPLSLQAKLLTVTEQFRFIPVGGTQYHQVHVRLISATSKDLPDMLRQRQFREDLYWRLSGISLTIPPLSQRPEDIRLLLYYYLNYYNTHYNLHKEFTPETFEKLSSYNWPGNVRQLKNTVERYFVLAPRDSSEISWIPSDLQPDTAEAPSLAFETYQQQYDRHAGALIREGIRKYGSSRKLAAAFGISQSKATRLMRKYGIEPLDEPEEP